MKDPKTFKDAGWDLYGESANGTDEIWGCSPNVNDGYPYLTTQFERNKRLPIFKTKGLKFKDATESSVILSDLLVPAYGKPDGYIVLMNTTKEFNEPNASTNYTANTSWQNAGEQCIYKGSSLTPNISIDGLSKSTMYYFKVIPYMSDNNEMTYEEDSPIFKQGTTTEELAPAGSGTEADPYLIENINNLLWLSNNSSEWGKNFQQTADIDADLSFNWDEGKGMNPIGNSIDRFTGIYDGNGHVISNLYINRPTQSYIGLFGYATNSARIKKLGVKDFVLCGETHIGGIVGYNEGNIGSCYTTGDINEVDYSEYAGGIAGENRGTISNCYTRGKIDLINYSGGIAGRNERYIRNCYSTVDKHPGYGGALASSDRDRVIKSFFNKTIVNSTYSAGIGLSTEDMTSNAYFLAEGWDFKDEDTNGSEDIWSWNDTDNEGYPTLTWEGFENEALSSCYAPLVPVKNVVWGVGYENIEVKSYTPPGFSGADGYVIFMNNENTWSELNTSIDPIANAIWQNSGQQCVYSGNSDKPKVNISGLTKESTYYFRIYAYNVCDGTKNYLMTPHGDSVTTHEFFTVPEGKGTKAEPYLVDHYNDLVWMSLSDSVWHNKYFSQTANINAEESKLRNNGEGFRPIGRRYRGSRYFKGTYDGQGFEIDGLYINNASDSWPPYTGLFGNTQYSEIKNIGLTNVYINSKRDVGALIGYDMFSTVTKCYSTGEVIGELNVGGLIGYSRSKISECYSFVNVKVSNYKAGGLVGLLSTDGYIKNCYARGKVTGKEKCGGFIGYREGGSVRRCYSTGFVDISKGSGGMFGSYTSESDCYYDKLTTGDVNSYGGDAKSTAEMKARVTFENWDFVNDTEDGTDDIWAIHPGINEGYPFFAYQWNGLAPQVSVLPDLKAACSITVTEIPKASDLEGNEYVGTTSDPLEYTEQGEYTITWTYDDGKGNTLTQKQKVIVEDTQVPVLVTRKYSGELDANGNLTVKASDFVESSSDNCTLASTIINKTDFDCSHIGNQTVQITLADAVGNETSESVQLTVEDNMKPQLSLKDFTVYMNADRIASIKAADIIVSSNDNCGISTTELNKTEFTEVGDENVEVTVTDASGNKTTLNSKVTVIDNMKPTVSLSTEVNSVSYKESEIIEILFSEKVNGFALTDLDLTNATAGNLKEITPLKEYSFDLTAINEGSVSLQANKVVDLANNGNQASNVITYQYENSVPVPSLTTSVSQLTNEEAIDVNLSFSFAVQNFDASKIELTNASLTKTTEITAETEYKLQIAPAGDGEVSVYLPAGEFSSQSGNSNTESNTISFIYDGTAPVASLSSNVSQYTNESTVEFELQFNEVVIGFNLSDLNIENATASSMQEVISGKEYKFNVLPSNQGEVDVKLVANKVEDLVGNINAVSNVLSFTYDTESPEVTITSEVESVTNLSAVSAVVEFSEQITNFGENNLSLVNANVAEMQTLVTGKKYSVVLNPETAGEVSLEVKAGVTEDRAGNGNKLSNKLSFTYDNTIPEATLSTNIGEATSESSISVELNFSVEVTDFDLSDLNVENAEASNLQTLSSSKAYRFDLTPKNEGNVSVIIEKNAVHTQSGSGNTVSNRIEFVYDVSAPELSSVSTEVEATSVKFKYSSNENGNLFTMLKKKSEQTPSEDDILKETPVSIVVGEGTDILFDNLEEKTEYVIYYLTEDKLKNKSQLLSEEFSTTSTGTYSIKERKVKLYPNPVEDNLNVVFEDFENCTIVITDLGGKTLLKKYAESMKEELNVRDLASGVYILKIENTSGTSTYKFIKR